MAFFKKKSETPKVTPVLPRTTAEPEAFLPTIISNRVQTKLRSVSIDHAGASEELRQGAEFAFKIRAAATKDRAQAANVLVKKMYSQRGYEGGGEKQAGHEAKQRQHRSNEVTLVAANDEKIFATLTVRYDSPAGLACDELYKAELDQLRARNSKLCEFTKFAVDSSVDSKPILGSLIHTCYLYAHVLRECSDIVIEVNPRHVAFYKKMMHFQQLGPQRLCSRVDAPAVLLHLPLRHMAEQIIQVGGQREQADSDKSFYPYFFSKEEEAHIIKNLLNLKLE